MKNTAINDALKDALSNSQDFEENLPPVQAEVQSVKTRSPQYGGRKQFEKPKTVKPVKGILAEDVKEFCALLSILETEFEVSDFLRGLMGDVSEDILYVVDLAHKHRVGLVPTKRVVTFTIKGGLYSLHIPERMEYAQERIQAEIHDMLTRVFYKKR